MNITPTNQRSRNNNNVFASFRRPTVARAIRTDSDPVWYNILVTQATAGSGADMWPGYFLIRAEFTVTRTRINLVTIFAEDSTNVMSLEIN